MRSLCVSLLPACYFARLVTISNGPRKDINGDWLDAHDGKIVEHNGKYFLYGESYGNQTLAQQYPWKQWPRLNVYTSDDLMTWTPHGDPLPMVTGTLWIPNVIYHKLTSRFIMWYGNGDWSTATSSDGIHFTPQNTHFGSRFSATGSGSTDGTGIFIDDDGSGYVAFAAMPPGFDEPGHPGWPGHIAHNYGHIVSIERMAPDLLSSSKVNVTGLFPDDFVESPSLFKRNGIYYLTYGSCCCGCSEGSGQVVFTAPAVQGPWARQAHADINCKNSTAKVCGGYSARNENAKNLVYDAQWWGPSFIPLANGDTLVLFLGRRWLSGPNVPAGCFDICGNGPPAGHGNKSLCQVGGDKYQLKSDSSVWYPLEFDRGGSIMPMKMIQNFTLDLPDLK